MNYIYVANMSYMIKVRYHHEPVTLESYLNSVFLFYLNCFQVCFSPAGYAE